MRKVILIFLTLFCVSSYSCKQNNGSETNEKTSHVSFVRELSKLSEESDLSWNIPYRKSLIESGRPMGYVFDYGVNYLKYEKDTSNSEIRIYIGVIFPESITARKKVSLCLDEKTIDLSKVDTLRTDKNTGVSEMNLYFELPLGDFLKSKRVCIEINGEKDLLISDKKSFDEKLINWHQRGKKTGKLPNGVLICPVRF